MVTMARGEGDAESRNSRVGAAVAATRAAPTGRRAVDQERFDRARIARIAPTTPRAADQHGTGAGLRATSTCATRATASCG